MHFIVSNEYNGTDVVIAKYGLYMSLHVRLILKVSKLSFFLLSNGNP